MELKPGYKQTEVGVIPGEWLVSCLGDCGEVIMGQSPPGSSYNRKAIGSPLINGPTEFTDRHPIKIQWTTQPTKFCKTGDLLICVRGSSTGRTNYANDSYAIGRGVAAIRAKDHNNTGYLSYQVISGVSEILAAATGSTFPSVDGASFRKIIVPLPSPAEQCAIAEALGDVDALLGALTQLIAKKRDLKQAAMQRLLTGQTRLPGFSREWEVKRLGEAAEVVMGQSTAGTSYNRDGLGAPLINGPTEFTDKHPIKIQWTSQPTTFCRKGDMLLCVRGSSTGRINISDDEYCIGRGVAAIRAKAEADTAFVTFQVSGAVQKILAATTGSTFPSIDGKSIRAIEVLAPPLREQTAIAAVLSDMDAELAALEQRLAKTHDLKQGMMQELLTGRTRLV